jgi:hypothetical protein
MVVLLYQKSPQKNKVTIREREKERARVVKMKKKAHFNLI